jgi:hypothetical protein
MPDAVLELLRELVELARVEELGVPEDSVRQVVDGVRAGCRGHAAPSGGRMTTHS